jgi:hypothetical protein
MEKTDVKRLVVALGVVVVVALGVGACSDDDVDTVVAGDPGGPDDSTSSEAPDPAEPPTNEEPAAAGLPAGPPALVGTIVSGDAGPELAAVEEVSAHDASYYEGGTVTLGDAPLLDADGEPIGQDEVFDQPAEIWLGGCAESYPVQCPVLGVRLVG